MKIIFEEVSLVVFPELVYRRRDNPELETEMQYARTRAYYDKPTGALVIDNDCLFEREWVPVARRLIELASTRELALRHVISVADAWYAEVKAAVPAEPQEIYLYDF